jgi:hypothetical protein
MNKKTRIVAIIIVLLAISAGVLFWLGKSKEAVAPVKTEEQKMQESANRKEEADVSKWKTYRNEEFNFEIRYPENWTIDNNRSDDNRLVFNPGLKDKPGSIEAINFRENKDNLNLEEIIEKQRNNYSQVIKKENFLFIGNERAWKIETAEFNISRIFFIYGNFMYEIESMGYLDDENVLNKFVFLK